jgi:hypothetical protein
MTARDVPIPSEIKPRKGRPRLRKSQDPPARQVPRRKVPFKRNRAEHLSPKETAPAVVVSPGVGVLLGRAANSVIRKKVRGLEGPKGQESLESANARKSMVAMIDGSGVQGLRPRVRRFKPIRTGFD